MEADYRGHGRFPYLARYAQEHPIGRGAEQSLLPGVGLETDGAGELYAVSGDLPTS
jgi:hypothetical protein